MPTSKFLYRKLFVQKKLIRIVFLKIVHKYSDLSVGYSSCSSCLSDNGHLPVEVKKLMNVEYLGQM